MTMELGCIAYMAYCHAVGGRSAVSGDPLPTWDEQKPEIRAAWRASADAVRTVLEKEES